jgi:hypothetical protein
MFGSRDNCRVENLMFEVVDLESPYHALLGRSALAKFMASTHVAYLKMKMSGPKCNNPNFWKIKINGFIKIPNFGDNKNFYFKYKINFLSFKTSEFEHLLPCFK